MRSTFLSLLIIGLMGAVPSGFGCSDGGDGDADGDSDGDADTDADGDTDGDADGDGDGDTDGDTDGDADGDADGDVDADADADEVDADRDEEGPVLGPELIENGRFESEDTNNDDFGWRSWHDTDERRVNGAGLDDSWGCVVPGALGPPESERRTIVEQLGVAVSGGHTYRFSVHMRTEDVGERARANIYFQDSADENIGDTFIIGAATGDTPWTEYEQIIEAPADAVSFNLHLRTFHLSSAPSGAVPGTAYFDDVSVREVE